ncbi:Stf0 family sulfotransferase [Limimaricola cinnabarinus]|uniref:Stf0 family sulfotransferase n=1 Tax=Limimaricola cinnabarinus TaxID=1125964 RepID=UPI0024922340|nr:Stf0 family sulfotransferase [Limimaricola cinnabarinus]
MSIKYVPRNDYIDAKYDMRTEVACRDSYILLSTPRSGSTMVCAFLHNNSYGIPHEYFQPGQYMKILSRRWNISRLNKRGLPVDMVEYGSSLLKYRTDRNGVFGCNIHGSHLEYFLDSGIGERLRPKVNVLVRDDVVSQAVSYSIASQSSAWSSHYKSKASPLYSFQNIMRKLSSIVYQNELIYSRFKDEGISNLIIYEDIKDNAPSELGRSFGIKHNGSNLTIDRQIDTRKDEFKKRFILDAKRFGSAEMYNNFLSQQARLIDKLRSIHRI